MSSHVGRVGIDFIPTYLIPLGTLVSMPLRNAQDLASAAHCNFPDTAEMIECLRSIPPEGTFRNYTCIYEDELYQIF